MRNLLLVTVGIALALLLVLRGVATAEGPPGAGPQTEGGTVLANPGTAFTYQGRLTDGGANPTASYGFQFKLYDALSSGSQVGSTLAATVPVTSGLFATDLDFGVGALPGQARWLEIGVRASGAAAYTSLTPRQALNPTPLALALPGLWTAQNATSPNLIGGYYSNTVTAGVVGAVIGGGGASGSANSVTDDYGTVGGGKGNRAGDNAGTTTDSSYATAAGGDNNTAGGTGATVGGGGINTASGAYSAIGGGWSNRATGDYATLAGGYGNTVTNTYGTVAGGISNTASGAYGTVAGGYQNTASNTYDAVGGGANNTTVTSTYGTIAGGQRNIVSGTLSTVGGGASNQAGAWGSTVAGGITNTASGYTATVGGGQRNLASNLGATVGGGWLNTASGEYGTVAGGQGNVASNERAAVGGGGNNVASGSSATVAGGAANQATALYSSVLGGASNVASGTRSTVAGGESNSATGAFGFAAGQRAKADHDGTFVWNDTTAADFVSTGSDQFLVHASGGVTLNVITGALRIEPNATAANLVGGHLSNNVTAGVAGATIGGGGTVGEANRVTDNYGTVGGGRSNRAGDNAGTASDARDATVGGGSFNTASGYDATIAGGYNNTASGAYATVGGGNTNVASGINSAIPGGAINVAGGTRSLAAGTRAHANHDGAFVWGDSTGDADVVSTAADQFIVRASGGVTIYTSVNPTVGATLLRGSTAWSVASDPALKANRAAVDGRQVVKRLADVPIESWSYITQDPSTRHMGPMAPDFRQAFGLGEDDQHISTVDADGVALAAIQGLHRELLERDARIEALEGRLAALETSSVGATGRSPLQASLGHAAAPEEQLAAPREGRASPAPTPAVPGASGWQEFGSALPGLMAGGLALGLVAARRSRRGGRP